MRQGNLRSGFGSALAVEFHSMAIEIMNDEFKQTIEQMPL